MISLLPVLGWLNVVILMLFPESLFSTPGKQDQFWPPLPSQKNLTTYKGIFNQNNSGTVTGKGGSEGAAVTGPGTFRAGAQEPCGTKMTQLSLHWREMTGQDWTGQHTEECLSLSVSRSHVWSYCLLLWKNICYLHREFIKAVRSLRLPLLHTDFLWLVSLSLCLMCKYTLHYIRLSRIHSKNTPNPSHMTRITEHTHTTPPCCIQVKFKWLLRQTGNFTCVWRQTT